MESVTWVTYSKNIPKKRYECYSIQWPSWRWTRVVNRTRSSVSPHHTKPPLCLWMPCGVLYTIHKRTHPNGCRPKNRDDAKLTKDGGRTLILWQSAVPTSSSREHLCPRRRVGRAPPQPLTGYPLPHVGLALLMVGVLRGELRGELRAAPGDGARWEASGGPLAADAGAPGRLRRQAAVH